jgi:cellobiose-specific phosphotransferase system component IIA
LRALGRLRQKGVAAVEETIQQAKAVLKSVKQYHLFTKQKKEKDRNFSLIPGSDQVRVDCYT